MGLRRGASVLSIAVFAFIGFGELGSSLAEGLSRSDVNVLRAYVPPRDQPGAEAALAARLGRSGTERSLSFEDAVAGAQAVMSVVPASASRAVAERCAGLLAAGACYVDLTAATIQEKEAEASIVEKAGGQYVDAAVLGTVATSGFAVPILASGAGAHDWQRLVAQEGLVVELLDAPAGQATLLKLLRSVYMKGRDALIVEMMLAARHYGLEERVIESIQGPGESVPFRALAERVLCAVAVHAERRSDELDASSGVVQAAGIDPIISRAGAEVLRRLARLRLRDVFDRERPSSANEVLAAIEERSGRPELSD